MGYEVADKTSGQWGKVFAKKITFTSIVDSVAISGPQQGDFVSRLS